VRIINEAGATDSNGDNVSSNLGVDNIQAVPEPASPTLLLLSKRITLLVSRKPTRSPLSCRNRVS